MKIHRFILTNVLPGMLKRAAAPILSKTPPSNRPQWGTVRDGESLPYIQFPDAPRTRRLRGIAKRARQGLFGNLGQVGGVIDDLAAQWDAAIADFQDAREALNRAETALYDNRYTAEQDPDDLAEWEKNLKKVIAQQAIMDASANAVTTVADWFRSAASYLPGMSGMKRDGALGSLGLVFPAFPITLAGLVGATAAAIAIVASVSAFITYLVTKRDRLRSVGNYVSQRTDELIVAGVDPQQATAQAYAEANEQATAEAKSESNYNFGVSLEKVAMWSAIAAGFVFVAPRLLDLGKRK